MEKDRWAAGIKVFIVPLASASASRRAVWAQQLALSGGAVSAGACGSVTHVALAPELSLERFNAWKPKDFALEARVRWVSTDWLISCLSQQRRVLEAQFPWPSRTDSPASPSPKGSRKRDISKLASPAESPTSPSPKVVPHASKMPEEPAESSSEVEELRPTMATFNGQLTPKRQALLQRKEKFACQRTASSSTAPAPQNAALAELFSRLQKHYESLGDGWRERSYRTTAGLIRSLPFEVTSVEDLERPQLKRLGKKTRQKMLEFLETGQIGRVEGLQDDEATKALNELQGIWGVGLTTARRWYAMGCCSVVEVQRQVDQGQLKLNSDQLIGLEFFHDFAQRIPRDEVSEIVAMVRGSALKRYGSRLRLEACGSYRRGKETCGDVDLLLCARTAADEQLVGPPAEVLQRLVADLTQQEFLTHDLKGTRWTGESHDGDPPSSSNSACYFGVCKVRSCHRRIDIKVHPRVEFPFALLSFTGSGPFNRSMRLFARRAGFSLSDHGICEASHARGVGRGQRLWTGPPIAQQHFLEEKDIFDFLGLTYREPSEREVDAVWLSETGVVPMESADEVTVTASPKRNLNTAVDLLETTSPFAKANSPGFSRWL